MRVRWCAYGCGQKLNARNRTGICGYCQNRDAAIAWKFRDSEHVGWNHAGIDPDHSDKCNLSIDAHSRLHCDGHVIARIGDGA